jgi:3-hydroxyisobutyrate dehydrogenase-like beta-hydroxyacid dehydrogenase
MKIGLIGLGRMGQAMGKRLLAAGHRLVVHNRTLDKATPLVAEGAELARTPLEAASDVELLLTMLADDRAVEDMLLGERGALRGLSAGAVHVSSSTIGPACSRRLGAAHDAALQGYVAAPVLGRPDAALGGELVFIAAGALDAIERCRPLFEALGKKTEIVGTDPPRANVVKLGANLVLASMIEALGEAYALVEAHGIADETFLRVVNGLLQSPVLGAYGKRIARNAFEPSGFELVLGAKDVRLAVETGESAIVPMPMASALRETFVAALAEGLGEVDWSVVGRASTRRLTTVGSTP